MGLRGPMGPPGSTGKEVRKKFQIKLLSYLTKCVEYDIQSCIQALKGFREMYLFLNFFFRVKTAVMENLDPVDPLVLKEFVDPLVPLGFPAQKDIVDTGQQNLLHFARKMHLKCAFFLLLTEVLVDPKANKDPKEQKDPRVLMAHQALRVPLACEV